MSTILTRCPALCAACAASIISESGLYKIIMRSDKPIAHYFQDRVTKKVLPATRKDGGYIMGEEKVRAGEMSALVFRHCIASPLNAPCGGELVPVQGSQVFALTKF